MKCNQCAKSFIIYANNSSHTNATFDCCCHQDLAANVNSKHRWKFRFSFITHKRNFETLNETSLENSFHQTKYLSKFRAMFRAIRRNIEHVKTIALRNFFENSKNFRFLRNIAGFRLYSSKFDEIRRNSLLLLLHSTVHGIHEKQVLVRLVVVSFCILSRIVLGYFNFYTPDGFYRV